MVKLGGGGGRGGGGWGFSPRLEWSDCVIGYNECSLHCVRHGCELASCQTIYHCTHSDCTLLFLWP